MLASTNIAQPVAHASLRREPEVASAKNESRARRNDDCANVPVIPRRWLVEPFQPISLKQLNAKAAMLERLDNKYVVRETASDRSQYATPGEAQPVCHSRRGNGRDPDR